MRKAFKYRIYPTEKQKVIFAKTFGCARKIWNLMLADKIKHYKLTGKMLKNTPAQYKSQYPFLKEVDSLALANVQIALQNAYANFFDRVNNPHLTQAMQAFEVGACKRTHQSRQVYP